MHFTKLMIFLNVENFSNWRTHFKYFLPYFGNHDLHVMLFLRCWYDVISMMFYNANDNYENVTNMFVMIHKNAHAMLCIKIMSSVMMCLWNIYAQNLWAQWCCVYEICMWTTFYHSIIMMMLWPIPNDVLWVDYMMYG